ncbi:phosphoglycerate kinase [Salvia divinorum]|uniref:Phosphoglycerate kinase n=1 Tax=Salvia divinorum TaxID=28513 RepID=A0ABD1GZI4_SALDI
MLQRLLVEAITDKLVYGGKVLVQSELEAIAKRMKEEFLIYADLSPFLRGGLALSLLAMAISWTEIPFKRGIGCLPFLAGENWSACC